MHGKSPCPESISPVEATPKTTKSRQCRVVWAGTYKDTYVIDLCGLPENFDQQFDLVICKSTLEHVEDAEVALASLVKMMKPGGVCYIQAPCRKEVFARLNRVIPQDLKRKLLHAIFPHKSGDGFVAFYDRATAVEYLEMLKKLDARPVYISQYYWSSYFGFFFPLYILWRLVSILQFVFDDGYCERFEIVFEKPRRANLVDNRSQETGI